MAGFEKTNGEESGVTCAVAEELAPSDPWSRQEEVPSCDDDVFNGSPRRNSRQVAEDGADPIKHQEPPTVRARSTVRDGAANDAEAAQRAQKISGFIKATAVSQEYDENYKMNSHRRVLKSLIHGPRFGYFVGALVFATLVLLIMDTDSRAPSRDHPTGEGSDWKVLRLLDLSYILFAVEVSVHIYVERRTFLEKTSNRLDMFVLSAGLLEYFLAAVGKNWSSLSVLRVFRLCRLLRLLRLFRLISYLRELKRLLAMMGSCFRTLFWSSILLSLVMIVWAVIFVELINPMVQELVIEGEWKDCERCARSYESVFMTILTLFSTIVGGDSWGTMALPVVERWPWTGFIFAPALMSVVFGVLNLIVAVVVDTFAKDSARDIDAMVADMEKEEAAEKADLAAVFEEIDFDGNGDLSFNELFEAASKVPRFSKWLRYLDIDARDLAVLFDMVDIDGSGGIAPEEFIEALYRYKNGDPKTATFFLKHLTGSMHKAEQAEIQRAVTAEDMPRMMDGDLLEEITAKQREVMAEFHAGRKSTQSESPYVAAAAVAAENQRFLLEKLEHLHDHVDTQLKKVSEAVYESQASQAFIERSLTIAQLEPSENEAQQGAVRRRSTTMKAALASKELFGAEAALGIAKRPLEEPPPEQQRRHSAPALVFSLPTASIPESDISAAIEEVVGQRQESCMRPGRSGSCPIAAGARVRSASRRSVELASAALGPAAQSRPSTSRAGRLEAL